MSQFTFLRYMKVRGKQPLRHLKRVLSFHGPSDPMLVNAKPPPERQGAGERRSHHPLEAEVGALMRRADPVPEEVVNAARRAYGRRWHLWGSAHPNNKPDRKPNGTRAATNGEDATS